jgi:hypothetical protein
VFETCDHISAETAAAGVLLSDENRPDLSVSEVKFVRCRLDRPKTIDISSGHEPVVTGCRFSGKREKEIGNERIVIEDCQFETEMFLKITQKKKEGNKEKNGKNVEDGD